jgi:hypothetical protein
VDLGHHRVVAVVEADRGHHPGALRRGDQLGALGGVERQRLLREDVQPALQRSEVELVVEPVDGAVVDRVQAAVVEQREWSP